jgi:aminomethyltransferase
MADGQIKYTLMCNEKGGIIDDLILYKYNNQKYMAVVNASNKEKDFEWISSHITGEAEAIDGSEATGLVALQGPKAKATLEKLIKSEDFPTKYYTFKEGVVLDGMIVDVSETGYTGENGYELYTKSEDVVKVWELLLEAGEEFNIVPCGLGARDTLRLEAGMPLYGHEMSEEINPLQVGLRFAVKLKKESFIGISTSGTHAPFLGYAIAMALVDKDYAEIGQEVEVEVRKRRIKAEVVPMPFYKK